MSNTSQLLDQVPIWGVFLITVTITLLALETGFRLGICFQKRGPGQSTSDVNTMVAASLAFLRFLLAFVIGMAVSLFNERLHRVIDEANAISTTYLRAGYISEPLSSESRRLLGVLLSFVMHIYRSAEKVEIVEIVPLGDGRYEERPAPEELPTHHAVVLTPQGSLFFAGAAEFEEDLPRVSEQSVVILRLRGREEVGSTFMRVIGRYALSLKECRGKLLLVGVSEPVYHQLEKTGLLAELGEENIYHQTSILGDSTRQAYQDAIAWLAKEHAAES